MTAMSFVLAVCVFVIVVAGLSLIFGGDDADYWDDGDDE